MTHAHSIFTPSEVLHDRDASLLEHAMRGLGGRQAQNVLLLHGDRLIANRPELLDAFQVTRFVPHPVTGEYRFASGAQLAEGGLASLLGGLSRLFTPHQGPDTDGKRGVQVECRPEKSGPYRRVFSRPGYSFQSARVYLPGEAAGEMHEEKAAGKGDTAFIYMGGWGGKGGAVDAGFQHGHAGGGPQDDWAPFFLVQQVGAASAVTVSDQKQSGGSPWRLLPSSEAELHFWVSQEGDVTYLSMFASGMTSVDRTPSTLTLRAPVDASFGWDAAGGDNILKRMTTIGQNYGQEFLSSGSFMKGVRWMDSRAGTSEAGAHAWTADDTGGYCSYPDPKAPEGQRQDGQGSVWTVEFRDPANETDTVVMK